MVLHCLPADHLTRIIPAVSQRIARARSLVVDLAYPFKKLLLSRNNWHSIYFIVINSNYGEFAAITETPPTAPSSDYTNRHTPRSGPARSAPAASTLEKQLSDP